MLEIAKPDLAAVRAKMAELRALDRSLSCVVRSCTETWTGGPAAKCSILGDMATPREAAKGCCS